MALKARVSEGGVFTPPEGESNLPVPDQAPAVVPPTGAPPTPPVGEVAWAMPPHIGEIAAAFSGYRFLLFFSIIPAIGATNSS